MLCTLCGACSRVLLARAPASTPLRALCSGRAFSTPATPPPSPAKKHAAKHEEDHRAKSWALSTPKLVQTLGVARLHACCEADLGRLLALSPHEGGAPLQKHVRLVTMALLRLERYELVRRLLQWCSRVVLVKRRAKYLTSILHLCISNKELGRAGNLLAMYALTRRAGVVVCGEAFEQVITALADAGHVDLTRRVYTDMRTSVPAMNVEPSTLAASYVALARVGEEALRERLLEEMRARRFVFKPGVFLPLTKALVEEGDADAEQFVWQLFGGGVEGLDGQSVLSVTGALAEQSPSTALALYKLYAGLASAYATSGTDDDNGAEGELSAATEENDYATSGEPLRLSAALCEVAVGAAARLQRPDDIPAIVAQARAHDELRAELLDAASRALYRAGRYEALLALQHASEPHMQEAVTPRTMIYALRAMIRSGQNQSAVRYVISALEREPPVPRPAAQELVLELLQRYTGEDVAYIKYLRIAYEAERVAGLVEALDMLHEWKLVDAEQRQLHYLLARLFEYRRSEPDEHEVSRRAKRTESDFSALIEGEDHPYAFSEA